jgi:hypothetical protein
MEDNDLLDKGEPLDYIFRVSSICFINKEMRYV